MTNLHRVSKMSHIWLAITLTHVNGIDIFGRNVTYTVGNQKTLYYVTWNNLCFCTTWRNGETRKSHFHSIELCYTYNAPVRCLPETNCHLWCVWQRLTFVEIVRYPTNTVHWLLLQAWRTTPVFHTATDTVTDWLTQSMWVTDSRILCSLPRSCLVHPVRLFWQWKVVQLWTVFCVFWWKACNI